MKFNAKKQTEKCIKWIRNYFINTKGEYAIIGIFYCDFFPFLPLFLTVLL